MRLPGAVRDHLRHNVVGYIALFCFVLGGTAVALPGKNKVNSADIKPNAVHASDIAKKAVRASKIAPNSVDGLRVIDNSLSGNDIDESTLNIRPGPSSIGPTELADRPRRIALTPGAFAPDAVVKLGQVGAFPVLAYPDSSNGFAMVSTDIPGGRVEGTKLTVRLVWSAATSGTVAWTLSRSTIAVGGQLDSADTSISTEATSTTPDSVTTTSFEIPGEEVQNGDLLGLAVERDTGSFDDTLSGDARLHLIEIDYTATG